MKLYQRTIFILIICLPSVGCDQWTKALAAQHLPRDQMWSYFYDVLRIGYTENIGAFLSLGASLTPEIRHWIFVVGVGAFLAGLTAYLLLKNLPRMTLIGFALLLSGGVSNFYDRVVNNGAVVDFLNVGIGPLRTGVFNIADMAIMLGLVLVLFQGVRELKQIPSPDPL
jgi:signal peptidase II